MFQLSSYLSIDPYLNLKYLLEAKLRSLDHTLTRRKHHEYFAVRESSFSCTELSIVESRDGKLRSGKATGVLVSPQYSNARSILLLNNPASNLQNGMAILAAQLHPSTAGSWKTIQEVLFFLPSLLSSCGDERIIIFTTNHRDRHDVALLRPVNIMLGTYNERKIQLIKCDAVCMRKETGGSGNKKAQDQNLASISKSGLKILA
ncbi:hypothetical protein Vadar_027073 [Vaccinium darrowii]|uniref:Uncharacterized protein n=1 Tax=Vaccinium darrowii TaxID=229202 RepID=A0ACB7YHM6_9ERIC|nr:hypothetical protein Vadar_027073 [Vaccinium darrowii]